jgi:outer membrane biogenesis lipoprotein LolB
MTRLALLLTLLLTACAAPTRERPQKRRQKIPWPPGYIACWHEAGQEKCRGER